VFLHIKLDVSKTKWVSYFLIGFLGVLVLLNYDKWYTVINFLYAVILTPIVLKYNIELLRKYYLTFLVMLIPFFLVNGILTGSFIENEVVWYNSNEILGIRLFTIPIEDSIYAFTLILTNLALIEFFEKKLFIKQPV